ncbi:unnamed protein product [Gongylonema pulchrum]|uniref:Fibronectin type-III domain-containing protein n=1 Tax=Gongylonema pulchrum TaxID=637853 RepID=A0A3P6NV28_9BILA|nr:unnamed protein product [Gongylonema pulchrum]
MGADDLRVDLSFLKPLTAYEVKVIAVNDVGNSNARSIVISTPEFVEGRRGAEESSWLRTALLIFVLFLSLILTIDIIRYAKHRSGLLALMCSNCFARSDTEHTSEAKSVLQDDKIENNHLLTDEQSSPPVTVKYAGVKKHEMDSCDL